jgi:hypothetical protein
MTDLVRRAYDAWNWYGLDEFARFLTEDAELHDAPGMVDGRRWHGRDEVLRRLDEVARTTGGGWVEIHDIRADEGEVRVEMTWKLESGTSRGTELGDVVHLVRVRGRLIDRIRVFLPSDEG